MENNNLQISIRDFRAIAQADISLNGITVLSGTNGTGKSSISRLVYYIMQYANEYPSLVISELRRHLHSFYDVLQSFVFSLDFKTNSQTIRELLDSFEIESEDEFDVFLKKVDYVCDRIKNEGLGVDSRVYRILQRTLDFEDEMPINEAIDLMRQRIVSLIEIAQQDILDRPAQILNDSIHNQFGESVVNSVTVFEYGSCLFGRNCTNVPLPHFIKNVFYINTPFMIDFKSMDDTSRRLQRVLTAGSNDFSRNEIAQLISDEIIGGETKFEEENVVSRFRFFDKKGNVFDLEECATGIKAFAIIQMLLNCGKIRNNTLLILDEPEAHLHPQWVVEYARLIVLMHKQLGVSFLISTHSTDMVSALKYISESEKCSGSLEYYCASPSEIDGKYDFNSIGLDIEPIFSSFNKSFDTLEHYAN